MPTARGTDNWLNNRGLRLKSGLVLGTLFGLFALTAVLFLLNQREVQDARRWSDHTADVLHAANGLIISAVLQQSSVRGYALTGDLNFLGPHATAKTEFATGIETLRGLTADNPEQQARLLAIDKLMQAWQQEFAEPVLELVVDSQRHDEVIALSRRGRGKELMDALRARAFEFVAVEEGLLDIREAQLADAIEDVRRLTIGLLFAAAALTVAFLFAIQRTLTTPMLRLTALIGRLTGGDLNVDVPYTERKDEVGAIAHALESFRNASLEVRQREWVKTHVAAIGQRLSQATHFERFARELLDYLCPLLGAGRGALFRAEIDGDAPRLIGAYGHAAAGSASAGGLVAQCATGAKPIVLDPVPADYYRIGSGLGAASPTTALLWPLPGIEGVAGVLELAAFRRLSDVEQEFMAQVVQLVGLSLEGLANAERTRELLEETRSQAEELQASEEALRVQQEELRATNEALEGKNQALEDQGNRLRASEEELRVQAEELRTTNESLNEKGRALNEFNERLLQFQADLETKNRELEAASRYKSEFLANMSHELRTPLNSLLILAKDLADNRDANLNTDQIESARIIFDSGHNLLQLINDILDLSKIEAGRMDVQWEDVDLAAVATAIERQFRPVARERKLELGIDIAPALPTTLRSDSTKIHQILTNLVGNALKFTHSGGVRVSITAAAAELVGADADPSQWIAIRVADTGIGIAADKLARLFQAFEQGDGTTSRRYGGTGLGLSISRGLARLLHGEIVVRSEAGHGAEFIVVLPLAGDEAQPGSPLATEPAPVPAVATPMPPATAAPSAKPATSPRPRVATPPDDRDRLGDADVRILIVEDDPAFSRILADMVRRKGYRALIAGDGETALELASEYRPSGILLDVNLPGMSGWAVMERLQAQPSTAQIPVHFISATDEAERGLAMGAVGFVTKPATRESIEVALGRVLKGATPSGPQRILVVEDDDGARVAVAKLLRQPGVELTEARSISAGLAALRQQTHDCIVLDLMLPDGSGFDFLDRAAQAGPVPPVVVYSARELTRDESLRLREYTDSIVIKGAQSPSRLLDEVSLFLHAMRRPAGLAAPSAPQGTDLGGRKVLLVDDDMRNVFALSRTLKNQGITVIAAQDGRKALAQLEEHPDIDWVLMDIMMPEMDGYEATREIRKQARWAQLPIIALTAKAMKGDREKCLAAGASDYLSKPIDVDKLLSIMRAWARSR
jgi:CheY-like chemotaxis protein